MPISTIAEKIHKDYLIKRAKRHSRGNIYIVHIYGPDGMSVDKWIRDTRADARGAKAYWRSMNHTAIIEGPFKRTNPKCPIIA